jgi:hypothetical protein
MSFSTVGVDESRVRKEGACGSNRRVIGTRGVTCQNKLPEKSQGIRQYVDLGRELNLSSGGRLLSDNGASVYTTTRQEETHGAEPASMDLHWTWRSWSALLKGARGAASTCMGKGRPCCNLMVKFVDSERENG